MTRPEPRIPRPADADADALAGAVGEASEDESLDLDPAAILASIDRQQRAVEATMLRGVPWLYLIWGAAMLIGYLVLWSAWAEGNPWFSIPVPVAASAFAAVLAAAMVSSAVIGSRIGRGVRGDSQFTGLVYGLSWPILSTAFMGLGIALIANGLPPELASLYFTSVFAIMAGALYLAGAALWRSPEQLVIGLILVAVGTGTAFAGNPLNLLLMALLGGGALLAAGVVTAVRTWGRR